MLTTVTSGGAALRVLAGTKSASRDWTGALSTFFAVSRGILSGVVADVRGGRLVEPALLFGAPGGSDLGVTLADVMSRIALDYDLPLRAPFEDTDSVAGALWSGRDLFGPGREDGLAKLRFAAGTLDLPLHVHEHSDRFIAVLDGQGSFWWSEEPWREFNGADISSTPVRAGDVLVFTRNLLHTFSAPKRDLLLLSYHSPEIPFDDPRQYTLPAKRWTPRMQVSH